MLDEPSPRNVMDVPDPWIPPWPAGSPLVVSAPCLLVFCLWLLPLDWFLDWFWTGLTFFDNNGTLVLGSGTGFGELCHRADHPDSG
ncbi:hypothetical protein CYMTET_16090 [Cymbomonas tetramitiformis]|uniref:Uncharacterized protein n=1 Tax=Cymbomonas tetramitiformis TaxID=36881 RepID=A0AAE0GD20_9CHLO|nr:hypothetical protein CYMTET_16090 [Cymbomonas tetramitiformis]